MSKIDVKKELRKIKSITKQVEKEKEDLADIESASSSAITTTGSGRYHLRKNSNNQVGFTLSGDYYVTNSKTLPIKIDRLSGNYKGCHISDGIHDILMCPAEIKSGIEGTLDKTNKRITFNNISDNFDWIIDLKDDGLQASFVINEKTTRGNFLVFEISDNVDISYSEQYKKVVFLDKTDKTKIFEFNSLIAFDDNNTFTKEIVTNMEQDAPSEYSLFMQVSNEILDNEEVYYPLTVSGFLEHVEKPIVNMKGFENNISYSNLENKILLGLKNNKSYSLKVTLNTETIISQILREDLKKYKVTLDLFYENKLTTNAFNSILVFNGANSIPFTNDSTNSKVTIDVTDQVKHNLSKYKHGLPIKNIILELIHKKKILNQSNFSLGLTNNVILDDDYVSVYEYNLEEVDPVINIFASTDGEVVPGTPFKEYNSARAGVTKLNLFNNVLTHTLSLGNISDNRLSIGVNLMYDTRLLNDQISRRLFNNNFSKGWQLNLSQRLIKDNSFDKIFGNKSIKYIDGDNNEHILEEKWYYTIDNVRYYIDKDLVILGSDKKLKYLDEQTKKYYNVEYEASNEDGLTLISTNSKLNYINQSDLKVKKHYYIRLSDNQKYEVFMDKNTGQLMIPHFVSNSKITKNSAKFKDLFLYTDYLSENNLTKYDSPKNVSYKYGDFLDNNGKVVTPIMIGRTMQSYKNIYYFYPLGVRWETVSKDENEKKVSNILYFDSEERIYVEVENEYYVDKNSPVVDYYENDDIVEINARIAQYQEQIAQIQSNLSALAKASIDTECDYNFQLLRRNYDITQTHDAARLQENYGVKTAFDQLGSNYDSWLKTYNTLIKYETQLMCLKEKKAVLVKEQKDSVQDYIIDTNGNVLGFDYYGKLIYITDKYENEITITYDEGKLTSVSSKEQKMVFKYDDNNLLECVIDNKGRRKWFKYDKGLLKSIHSLGDSNNKMIISFSYDTKNHLTFVSDGNLELNITMAGDVIENILQKSTRVVENNKLVNNGEETLIANDSISNSTNSKCITNNMNGEVYKYLFDNSGQLIKTINELSKNKVEIAINHFDANKLLFSASYLTKDVVGSMSINKESTKSFEVTCSEFNNILRTQELVYIDISFDTSKMDLQTVKGNEIILKVNVTDKNDKIRTYEQTFVKPKYECLGIPFVLRKDDKNLTFSFDSTKELDLSFANVPVNIYQAVGSINEYDEDRLTYTTNGDIETFYENIIDDNPTQIRTVDKYGVTRTSYQQFDSDNHLVYSEDHLKKVQENSYDENGRLIQEKTYNKEDLSLAKVTKYEYDEKGNVTKTSGMLKDESGEFNDESYEYDKCGEQITHIRKVNGQTISYGYDFNTDDVLSITSDALGKGNSTKFKYVNGFLSELSHNNFKINYNLDGVGRKTLITVGNLDLFIFEYNDFYTYNNDSYCKCITKTDCLGKKTQYIYDKDDKLLKTILPSSQSITYTYDEDDRLIQIHGINNEAMSYIYSGDLLTSSEYNKGQQSFLKEIKYKDNDLVKQNVYTLDQSVILEESFYYDSTHDNRLRSTIVNGQLLISYIYDALGRIQSEDVTSEDVGIGIINTYDYLQNEECSTDLIKTHSTNIAGTVETVEYGYDINGNIILEEGNDYVIRYQYDKLNRLIREDNQKLNETKLYSYDKGGNLLSVKECEFTLETDVKVTNVITLSYANARWKDKLIKINNKPIKYEALGRMNKIGDDVLSYNDEGKLSKFNTITFTYDINGRRQTKGNKKYYYDGNRLIREEITEDDVINYEYSMEKVVGFTYNKHRYIYQRNIQGDIIGILDVDSETIVAKYNYDAWGNHKVIEIGDNNIGEINPIRYRGYYYDKETGLYYLNSRYYSPELRRFICADEVSILDETKSQINGLNLYMYCNDNPVMYADPSGYAFIAALLISMGIAALIGGATAGYSAYQSGERGWDLVADIAGGAIFGAAVGATIALGGAAGLAATGASVAGFGLSTGAALGISVGATAVAGMAKYSLDCVASNENNWNFGGFVLSGVEGALQGAATFGLAFVGGKSGLFNKLGNFRTADAFYINHGGMNTLRAVFWSSKVLIGETLSKALFVSGSAALARWLIDLMIPDLY